MQSKLFLWVCFAATFVQAPEVNAQSLPQFTVAGVVSAASYAQPISPQSIVSIFGVNLASTTASATSVPLPTTLGGTTVKFNGEPAPLFYVSPTQVNVQVPSIAVFSPITVNVSVTTAAGSSDTMAVPFYATGPGMFSQDHSGCGPAAALNASQAGTPLNSSANSAAPGDYITLFGTGFGLAYWPTDGTPPGKAANLEVQPGVDIDGGLSLVFSLQYAGLAPTLVGVDQINFQIPATARQGCAIPFTVQAQGYTSPAFPLSIHTGGGPCVDPPAQSYGQVSLVKTITAGTSSNGSTEVLTASFPSGPGLPIPAAPAVTPSNSYTSNAYLMSPVSRTCVAGFTQLSAGPLQVSSPANSVTAQPTNGAYNQTLPAGFIGAGSYNITASGSPVAFQGTMVVSAPIQIQTALPSGTVISQFNPFTVTWTGGVSGDLVKITVVTHAGGLGTSMYAYADAAAGSFTFNPSCQSSPSSGKFCTFYIPPSGNVQVIVEQSPGSANTAAFQASGITTNVQATWTYRWIFGGLSLQ